MPDPRSIGGRFSSWWDTVKRGQDLVVVQRVAPQFSDASRRNLQPSSTLAESVFAAWVLKLQRNQPAVIQLLWSWRSHEGVNISGISNLNGVPAREGKF